MEWVSSLVVQTIVASLGKTETTAMSVMTGGVLSVGIMAGVVTVTVGAGLVVTVSGTVTGVEGVTGAGVVIVGVGVTTGAGVMTVVVSGTVTFVCVPVLALELVKVTLDST